MTVIKLYHVNVRCAEGKSYSYTTPQVSSCDAVLDALDIFGEGCRISAQRVHAVSSAAYAAQQQRRH